MIKVYDKIPNLFLFDTKTHKMTKDFDNEYISYLYKLDWDWTDKVDGTNIRVHWDGYKISFYGRTDQSIIIDSMKKKLDSIFIEEVFEQVFGEKEVVLFGEGYGGKIQVGIYNNEEDFILFDVWGGERYWDRKHIPGLAETLGIKSVPTLVTGDIDCGLEYIKKNNLKEGLVGTTKLPLYNNKGKRIAVKLKNKYLNIKQPNDTR